MTEEATRESVSEEVNRKFNAMHCADLASQIDDEGMRRNISVALCGKYGVPDRQDYSVNGTGMMLTGCRLKEDAIPNRDKRTEMRGFLVGLLTEAIMTTQGTGAGPVADAPPAPESQAEGAAPEAAGADEVLSLDLRSELAKGEGQGPARFVAGPPDVKLFPGTPAGHGDVPADYVSLLVPPPPLEAGERQLSRWIAGAPVSESGFAFGLPDLDERGFERMADIEAEFLSAPKVLLERSGQMLSLQRLAAPKGGVASKERLVMMQEAIGATNASDLDILNAFRDAVARTLKEIWPERAKSLEAAGATLRTGSDMMPLLRQGWSIEQGWLEEFGGALEGPEPDLRGHPLPEGRFEPGLLFRRAAFLHLVSGMHTADAILEAAYDVRIAQALRGQDQECTMHILMTFDDAVMEDCTRPVSSYRVAKNEMEPAF